jgi:hypothetical protein
MRDREERSAPEDCGVDASRDARRHDERHERPGRELEQEKLDGEHHGRERRAEHRRHPGSRAAREQDLPLGRRHLDDLAHDRAQRTAGDDDRPFGAERSTGPDGHGSRRRLGDPGARRDAAVPRRIASIASRMP